MRKLTTCLYYEGEQQRTVKSSTIPSGTHYFSSFQNLFPTSGMLEN